MKKFFTLAICFFCGILLSQAQISRGTTYINPQISGFNISGTDNNKSKKDKFNFALDIKGGNFISDNLAVIVGLGMDLESQEKYRNSKIDVSAGFRYYTLTTLFIGAETGYEHGWQREFDSSKTHHNNYWYISAKLGYAFFLKKNISLDPALYWKYSFTDRFNQYGLKIGLSLYF